MPPNTCPRNSPSERHELVDSSVAEVESLVEPVSRFRTSTWGNFRTRFLAFWLSSPPG